MSRFAKEFHLHLDDIKEQMRVEAEMRDFVDSTMRGENEFYERVRPRPRAIHHGAVFVTVGGTLYHVAPLEYAKQGNKFLTLCRKHIVARAGTLFERYAVMQLFCPTCLDEYRIERSVLLDVIAREQPTIDARTQGVRFTC